MSEDEDRNGGFDKEAEREKLREKLERDREKRQHTRKMSELLLKGATMTNRHCPDCGDPIFRQNGREFCPTCGAEVADADAADAAAGDGRAIEAGTARGRAADAPDAQAGGQPGSEDAGRDRTQGVGAEAGEADRVRSASPADGEKTAGDAGMPTPTRTDRRPATPDPPAPTESGEGRGGRRAETGRRAGEDLGTARDALARTVEKFARAAAAADDPRRAKEHLEAAREAAEALAVLE